MRLLRWKIGYIIICFIYEFIVLYLILLYVESLKAIESEIDDKYDFVGFSMACSGWPINEQAQSIATGCW